ncbi:MAG: NUDIX hydrolase [Defluviitaleaceae bacterium]|nr:NUDIX hydrolase [Defluviitaleaceae bacterium]MCL2274679.1 NUDIX hydrolase [Defluviitaleaceae bacterium]MCL2275760.1 NUDIX hydrolase [Defluviitaleaceae bacterium]
MNPEPKTFPTHIVAATGYVFDANDNLLLVKTHHRGWDATGGQIENGESLEEGVLREILEESGITARVRCLVGVYSNVGQHVGHDGVSHIPTKVIFEFMCDYVGGIPTPSDETSEVKWVPRKEVMSFLTQPVVQFRFEKMLNFTGQVNYGAYVTKPAFTVLSDRVV